METPFLPLRLQEEHLGTIESIWLVRRRMLFSSLSGAAQVRQFDARLGRHIRALCCSKEEALRHASIAAASRAPSTRFAGFRVLLSLAPEELVGPRRTILPEPGFALIDALRHAPLPQWLVSIDDPNLLDAVTFQGGDVSEKIVGPAIQHRSAAWRRAGVLAAGRGSMQTMIDALRNTLASDPEPDLRVTALYALGLMGGAPLIESALSDGSLAQAPSAALVLGMFGAPSATGWLLSDLQLRPAPLTVAALGLLGSPTALQPLADRAVGTSPLAHAALRALHTITGVWFTSDGDPRSAPDAASATRYIAANSDVLKGHARWHLGRPTSSTPDSESPLSAHWLHALAHPEYPPAVTGLRFERPDALSREGYGALDIDPFDVTLSRRELQS